MNRFTYRPDLRIGRASLLILAFAFLSVTILGCGTGINIVPIGAKIQNADNAFDQAETMDVRDEDPEKWRRTAQSSVHSMIER